MFQILVKDEEGRNIFLREQFDEQQADAFVETLSRSGISAVKVVVEQKKTHVVSVVFKLDDVSNYSFEDPNSIARVGDLVEVECTDGRHKIVLVKSAGYRTPDQIKEFCAKIGYRNLGKVIKVVWRPNLNAA